MLGHDAFILDGHVIAGERHHPRAAGAVPVVEGKGLGGRVWFGHRRAPKQSAPVRRMAPQSRTPVCRANLRAFPASAKASASYTFGGHRPWTVALSRLSGPRGP